MRLYHGCGTVLTIKHTISLILVSNFDLEDDKVLLTKHKLLESKYITPHINLKDCKTFFCNRCGEEVSYPKCLVSCDDCGSFFEQNDVKSIGGLLFCRRCLGKNKNFSDFNIFGEKSKTKKQRDRVIEEAFFTLSSEIVPANTAAPPQVSPLTQQVIVNTLWNSTDVWSTTTDGNTIFTSSGTRR
jgi:hypothetical protein